MKLALNFSPPAAGLLAEGRIDIDYFKCPDWPEMIMEALHYRPVAVHFTLRAGTGLLHKTDWAFIERLMKLTGTPYVNLHLDPQPRDFPTETGCITANTQEPAHTSLVMERLLADVSAVVEQFGPERVIAENVPYWGANGEVLRPATEAVVIRRILEETGCGLLLDVAHARISAHYLNLDPSNYLATLPVEHTREMHFGGIHWLPEGPKDHLSMTEGDWPWLEQSLANVRTGAWGKPWLLAFEYGGVGGWFTEHTDPAAIAENVPELWRRIKITPVRDKDVLTHTSNKCHTERSEASRTN
jgi:uncharacterized protein (UPF0276 family)